MCCFSIHIQTATGDHSLPGDQKDMAWTLFIHGKKVDTKNCTAIRAYYNVNEFISKIDSLNMCAGHPESRFSEISKAALFH